MGRSARIHTVLLQLLQMARNCGCAQRLRVAFLSIQDVAFLLGSSRPRFSPQRVQWQLRRHDLLGSYLWHRQGVLERIAGRGRAVGWPAKANKSLSGSQSTILLYRIFPYSDVCWIQSLTYIDVCG